MRRQFYWCNIAGVHLFFGRERAIGSKNQLQGIVGLRQFPFSFGNFCPGTFNLPTSLFKRQDVRAAGHQLLLNERQGLLVIFQRIPCNTQLFIRQLLVEIALRHIRDEQNMHGATRLFTGEIILSVSLTHVSELAEEIEIVAKRNTRVILLCARFVTFQTTAVSDTRRSIQLRITICVGHIELCPGLLNLQRGHF